MGFSFLFSTLILRSAARASRRMQARLWPRGSRRRSAPPHHEGLQSRLPRHLLRPRAEHVFPRFLVERLLHELADRQPGLHLRPGTHLGVPALDVWIIVERKTL